MALNDAQTIDDPPRGATPMIGKTISHYKILEKLGEGGIGVVYKALDTKLDRHVALKFLSPRALGTDEEAARFVREAKAAAALSHPNICTIYEIDDADGQTFIAMALIEGQSLKEKLASGRIELNAALRIATDVAEGLAAAHARGIVHRDIKPGNVMVTSEGRAKIMDFGLAKLLAGDDLTRSGSVVGTLPYMSPEQVRSEKPDGRSDIWSLGVLLYEMLVGQRPFRGDHPQAVLYSILHQDSEPLRGLRPEAPRGLESLVARMLARSPESRPASAAEVVCELRRLSVEPGSEGATQVLPDREHEPAVAVLPFHNVSSDPEQEHLCDGMAEELINSLVRLGCLRVVARTSAFAFKGQDVDIREIGRKLSVNTILEGSIQRSGDRLRITAQLVDVTSGYHLWSERYEREMTDVFEIQDEICSALIEKLTGRLLPRERGAAAGVRTTDFEAYELYLKGRLLLDQRTVVAYERSRRVFEEAIARDPTYPLPYTGLAEAFIRLNNMHRLTPQDAQLGATRAAARALELGPSLAETHVALGWIRWDFEDDLSSAETAFRRAIELSPGHARAHMRLAQLLEHTDRPEEALEEAERALRLDPMSASVRSWMVHFKARLRDWRGAVDLMRETLELHPADAASHSGYGYVVASLGRSKEGSEHLRRALELDPKNPVITELSAIVLLRQREFEKALGEAQKLIGGSPSDHDGHALAGEALVGLSHYEEAIAAFNRAKEAMHAHDPEGQGDAQFLAGIDGMLGIAYAREGNTDRGEEVLRDLIDRSETEPVPRGTLATLCFALGKTDEGFAWLQEACERTESIIVALRTSPWLDDARSDPRFEEVLESVGLADYPPDEEDS
jgi:TolB-like protein/cytochrome c-type biogenesis protein CcmH/NrfG/predicted Ser/Thr protein kinase